jgi:beta-lactam-binding protein with PASTA domain
VLPDTDFKTPAELIARETESPEEIAKQREEQTRAEEVRESTMPKVPVRDNRGSEVVYAVATSKAILMPDLKGRSVRDVARACAQLGLQLEAHGEGRVVNQTPQVGSELRPGQRVYVNFGRSN